MLGHVILLICELSHVRLVRELDHVWHHVGTGGCVSLMLLLLLLSTTISRSVRGLGESICHGTHIVQSLAVWTLGILHFDLTGKWIERWGIYLLVLALESSGVQGTRALREGWRSILRQHPLATRSRRFRVLMVTAGGFRRHFQHDPRCFEAEEVVDSQRYRSGFHAGLKIRWPGVIRLYVCPYIRVDVIFRWCRYAA